MESSWSKKTKKLNCVFVKIVYYDSYFWTQTCSDFRKTLNIIKTYFKSFSESIRDGISWTPHTTDKMARIFLKSRQALKTMDWNDARFITTYRGKSFALSTDAASDFSNDINLFDEKIEKYSLYHPTPISIAHFIEFGQKASAENSFTFLKREVPVRYLKWLNVTRVLWSNSCFGRLALGRLLYPSDPCIIQVGTGVLLRSHHFWWFREHSFPILTLPNWTLGPLT